MVVYTWNDENDLKDCLKEAIEKELPEEEGKSLSDKIRKSIGLDDVNKALNDPSKVERFQVLSPVKIRYGEHSRLIRISKSGLV